MTALAILCARTRDQRDQRFPEEPTVWGSYHVRNGQYEVWGGGPLLQGGPLPALCSALLQTRPRAERVQLNAFLQLVQFSTVMRSPPARFSTLRQESREALVTSWLRHAPEFIRGGLAALKSLAALAHYGEEKSWARLGYDGPWLGRKTIEVSPKLVPACHPARSRTRVECRCA